MVAHAIVIGIDAYRGPGMELKSAVADACKFARWALEHGDVAPADLTLMLAPLAGKDPDAPTGVVRAEPTRREINKVLHAYTNQQRGKGADRLYFYFAGHGLAGAAAAHLAATEPVIVPSDYESAQLDSNLLLGFSQLFPLLRQHPPKEQIFFVDACRDYAPPGLLPAPGQAAMYAPPPSLDLQSTQCVLYGTSLGMAAKEHEGQGIFTDTLLESLRGNRAELSYSYERSSFRLRFDPLANAVANAVRQRAGGAQIPEPRALGDAGFVIAELDVGDVPTMAVKVLVQPQELGTSCTVELLEFSMAKRALVVTERAPVDSQGHALLSLPPGTYALRAIGPSCGGDTSLRVLGNPAGAQTELLRVKQRHPPVATRGLVLESFNEAAFDPLQEIAARQPAARVAPSTGNVLVTFSDPGVDIRLSRGGRELKRARRELKAEGLASGVYVATVEVAGRTLREDILVLAGESVERDLTVPSELHARPDLAFLLPFGVSTRDGFVHIDGVAWPLATSPLTEVLSLLARARMAAQADWLGIPTTRPTGTRVLVIVAAPDDAQSLLQVGAAVDQVGGARRDVLPGRVALGSHAAVIHGDIAPGPIEVRLELPGIVQTNIAAMAFQGDTLAVLVVLRKSRSAASAVVHLAHVGAAVPLEVVRELERAQQVLARASTLDASVVQRAADAAASAPLFAMLAEVGPKSDVAVTSRAAREQPRALGRELLPGAIWATWVRERPTLQVRRDASRQTFASAPASWLVLEARRSEIERALPAVGTALLEGQPVGTAFLVAPDLAVTASFIADQKQLSFRFGDQSLKPKQITSDPRSFLSFIRLEREMKVDPLRVASGVPALTEPRTAYLLTWFVDGGADAFAVSPGLISAIRPAREVPIAGAPDAGVPTHDILIHDCDSRAGTAGAPLFDLATGEVVGLHHSGEEGLSQTGIATVLVASMIPQL